MSFNKSRKETMMRPGGELEVVEEVEEEEEELGRKERDGGGGAGLF